MKLELNVKRFNNEDVIATSVCNHLSAEYHMNITTYNASGNDEGWSYQYDSTTGKLYKAHHETENVDVRGITSSGWWYSNDDGHTWNKCNDNCEHPILKQY